MEFWPETLVHLNTIVSERVEESQTLEFKRELPKSGQNDDVAKDLSAMANTEGGLIVYGVDQDDDGRAKNLLPLILAGVPERLAQVARGIDEPLAVDTWIISDSSMAGFGYVIARVAASRRAPHFVRGVAWARSSRHLYPLSRRQIGELFARSSGFAEEFGLNPKRPGRVKVTAVKEHRLGTSASIDYYLVFENDGEEDVCDARWRWIPDAGIPYQAINDPFPIEKLHVHAPVRVFVSRNAGGTNSKVTVETRWRSHTGEGNDTWPVSW